MFSLLRNDLGHIEPPSSIFPKDKALIQVISGQPYILCINISPKKIYPLKEGHLTRD